MMNIPLESETNMESDLLNKIRFNSKENDDGSLKIYKIPFEYGLNLLYTMNFYLKNGYIYITNSELEKLAETVFKENLLKKINIINRNIDKIKSDSRIEYLIKEVESKREVKTILNINKISSENKISIQEIEEIYDKYFHSNSLELSLFACNLFINILTLIHI
jgi:DNA primase large subunit